MAGLAKYFTPESDDQIFLRKLWQEVEWHKKLSSLTDEQLADVVSNKANDLFGTYDSVIVTEVVTRLTRSKGGPNP